ncbi:MAG: HDOD domain-containing protein [Acidimicrobiia bacterium]
MITQDSRLGLSRIEQLPAISPVVVRLIALDPSARDYYEQVVEIANSDPDLAMRVIGSANSAAYSSVDVVDTVPRAVARIGSARVGYLVLAMSMFKIFPTSDHDAVGLWHHAVETAVAAQTLATRSNGKVNAARAYTAGLLHDVGRFLLHADRPGVALPADRAVGDLDRQLAEERALTGDADHVEFGSVAAEYWRLPPNLAPVVAGHHVYGPPSLADPETALLTVVQTADLLSSALRRHPDVADAPAGDLEALIAAECRPDAWTTPPFTAATLAALVPDVVAQSRQALTQFGITEG